MTLLYIYIGTIIFFWLSVFCFLADVTIKAREKGYIIPAKDNKLELFVTLFKMLVTSCIPVFNVILSFLYLFSDDIKNNVLEKYKPKGEI